MCLRYQDKVTTVTKKDPAASLDEMVQTTTNTFHNREQEREAKSQDRERKKKKKKDKACPDAGHLQGSPMANPEFLKDKAQGKCLICRHWTKGSKQ